MDEIKLGIARQKAVQADALMQSEAMQEAFSTIDKELVDAWRTCTSAKGRDRIWQSINYVKRVQTILRNVVAAGRVAEKDLAWLNSRRKAA